MTGPWPHPKTGILYYRKATPPDIFAARARLLEMGITVTREIQRSLQTKDRKPAERAYKQISEEVEAEWDRWRTLLQHGPIDLSHKNVAALAGADAAAYVKANEDDPHKAPSPEKLLKATIANIHAEYSRRSLREGQQVFELGEELKTIPLVSLPEHISKLLQGERPGARRNLLIAVASALVAFRETVGWMGAKGIAAKRGLAVTRSSRKALASALSTFREKAWKTLQAQIEGDYREPEWIQGLPAFEVRAGKTSGGSAGLSLEYLLDHKAGSQSIKTKTVDDTRSHLRKFIQFIGHDDARRVTKDDVRKWRDSLIALGGLSPKTISDRYLSAISSVLSHGVKEFDLPANVASGIKDKRAAPAPNGSKGYSDEQAVAILKATIKGSSKEISEPHRRAVRWVPWILAYTGLRVSEVTQFQGKNLREEGGIPYLLITPDDGSTKSGKAWTVGIHKHLIELGLVEFIRSQGNGPLFYHAYEDGTDLTKLDGKHRAQDTAKRVSDWVTKELGVGAPNGRPNHAWRHLFTTRSRQCGMDKEARDYMLGSRSQTDAREGYGDWPPRVLDAEINKIPKFAVGKASIHT